MKLWKKALIKIICRKYKIPVVGYWYHSPVRVLDGGQKTSRDCPPVLYDLSNKEIVRKRLRKPEPGGGNFWLRTEIRVGKDWLKTNLTEKQFASYTIEILENGRKEIKYEHRK